MGTGVFKPHHLSDLQLASEPFSLFKIITIIFNFQCAGSLLHGLSLVVACALVQLWPAGLVALRHMGSCFPSVSVFSCSAVSDFLCESLIRDPTQSPASEGKFFNPDHHGSPLSHFDF